jgi:hypothetical protein
MCAQVVSGKGVNDKAALKWGFAKETVHGTTRQETHLQRGDWITSGIDLEGLWKKNGPKPLECSGPLPFAEAGLEPLTGELLRRQSWMY